MKEKIQFPFQYITQYLLGEISLEVACDSTMEECSRLIEEYIEKHNIEFEDPEEFARRYCYNCSSIHCMGVGTPSFKDCGYKGHLKDYEKFYG